MNRRRQILFLALIVVLAEIFVVATRFVSPRPPLLLQRATKLADVQEDTSYCWLPSNQLLVVTNTSRSPNPWGLWSGYLETIDPQTGKRTRLEGLTAAIMRHATHYNALHGPMMFSPSPDGKWLRWSCFKPAGDKSGRGALTVTAGMDGSGYHEWPIQGISISHWLDGHRWAGTVDSSKSPPPGFGQSSQTGYIVHDAAHPGADHLVPATSPELSEMSFLSPTPSPGKQSARIFANAEDKGSSVEVSILSSPAGATMETRPATLDTLIYPPGSWVTTEQTNPQQTRILLFVHESGIPLWVTFVRKLLPSYSYSSHPFEHLCFYRADTREVVEVGRIDETPAHDEAEMKMGWLPDGKHIQFFYHNAVYIVSTD